MNIISLNIKPDVTKGFYTRTIYDETLQKIKLLSPTEVTSFPGDTSRWSVSGDPWEIIGDKLKIISDAGGNYLNCTYNLMQETDSMYPILFRIKAIGENILGSGNYSDWGIQLRVTFTDEGLSGGSYEEVHIAFPQGSWDDTQFSVLYTPTVPVRYIYAYIYARNYTGTITAWDAEIIQLNTDKSMYGTWESEIIDLHKLANIPVINNTITLDKIAFKYGLLDNVDNLYSVKHSLDVLSKFEYIVCEDPARLNSRELQLVNELTNIGVKVFGYTYIGYTDSYVELTDLQLRAVIDACHANGFYGVFFDMAGYDYHVSRDKLNTYTDYVHSKGMYVMANAWVPSNLLSSDVHVTYNPLGTPTKLGNNDWILLESFYSRGDDSYADEVSGMSTIMSRWLTSVELAHSLNVKVVSLADKFSTKTLKESEQDILNSYLLSCMCGVDAWSFGTTDYTYPNVPVIKLGNTFTDSIKQISSGYWERETDYGCVWFDFNTKLSGAFSKIQKLSNVSIDETFKSKLDDNYTIYYYISSDKINWVLWDKNNVSRYFKVKVEFTY